MATARGAPGPADVRVGRGAVPQGRVADLGLAVASRRRSQGRGCFSRNCATTLPPGQAPPAGFGTGGSTTRGRTVTGRGGRGFCEIAQRPSGQVPRGCARCTGPAPAWWRLRPGWVFGAAHTLPGRCATRPLPHAGEVNMAAWRVRPGGPAVEGAARGSRVWGARLFRPTLDAGVGRRRAASCVRHSLVQRTHEIASVIGFRP